MLRNCPGITRYYMLDPWEHLEDWNKPSNVDQSTFDDFHAQAMAKTDFAAERQDSPARQDYGSDRRNS